MLAYNYYVKKKELEVRDAINQLGNNSNSEIKDLKIQKLEMTVSRLRQQMSEQEKQKEVLRDEIKSWKKKYEVEKQEHQFYHNSALENKRKTKLLKVAVSRLQLEYDKLKEKYSIADNELSFVKQLQGQIERVQKEALMDQRDNEDDAGTFMTRVSEDGEDKKAKPTAKTKPPSVNGDRALVLPDLSIKDPMGLEDTFVASGLGSVGPRSMASSRTRNGGGKFQTAGGHKRAMSNAVSTKNGNITSRYRKGMIPTENLKFHQFMDILFSSRMTRDEIKDEACSYIQVLETNYTDKITALKVSLEKSKRQTKVAETKHTAQNVKKSDLEQLFVRCVEDQRKEIIRRRLKAEVTARKKVGSVHNISVSMQSSGKLMNMSQQSEGDETQREFEETLTKLAEVAKNRVKFEEFSQQDRSNILDLFVNNEQTLLKIYEILFPQPSFKQS